MTNLIDQNTAAAISEATTDYQLATGLIGYALTYPDHVNRLVNMVRADDFLILKDGHIWQIITDLHTAKLGIDSASVLGYWTIRYPGIELTYTDLIEYARNAAQGLENARAYATLIARQKMRRDTVDAALGTINGITEGKQTTAETVSEGIRLLSDIQSRIAGLNDTGVTYTQAVGEIFNNLGVKRIGIPTGIAALDRQLTGNGWHPGNFGLFAGRPGVGKSIMLIDMCRATGERGIPCEFFSLEMSQQEVSYRIVASRTGIDYRRIMGSQLSDEETGLIVEEVEESTHMPIHIDDRGGVTTDEIIARIKTAKRERGIQVAFIDYSGLIKLPDKDVSTINRMLAELKNCARTEKIALVVAHQLNRDIEKRVDKTPVLSDLRDAGGYEATADVVVLMHRDVMAGSKTLELHIAKQRMGPVGRQDVQVNLATNRIEG